jgi:hypothetical protein
MMLGLLLLLFFQPVQKPPRAVGAELLARNLPVPKDAADLDQPITSYAVLDDNRGFVIAYYARESDDSLHELRVRSFDSRTRAWRSKAFAEPIGSILKVQRNAGYLYITGHSSPSATPLLVLAEDLTLKRELDGWPVLMLDEGRVIFERSMVHFAPAHAEALALYDPAADREESLYPPPAANNARGIEMVPGSARLFVDRSFADVKTGTAAGTVEFVAVEQPIRLNQANGGEPAGEKQRQLVACRVAVSPAVCEQRSAIQDDLVAQTTGGASISGRVLAEAGAADPSAVGMRITASPVPERYDPSALVSALVASDGSFRMTGLSGSYQFFVNADRQPFVQTSRVTMDGRESPAAAGVELTSGDHDVVVFVSPREPLKPPLSETLSTTALVEAFTREKVFWRQALIGQQIVDRRDPGVVTSLSVWLAHEDRHIRGNAAFVVGRLGDPRGFQVIAAMLTDRSDRPEGQGIPVAPSDGRYHVATQIATDRYYAVHLLGELRDPQALPILVPLLKDPQVNNKVAWALGLIGDKRAVGPLLEALDDDRPSMRVAVIYALEALDAKEAVPRLIALLEDHRRSNLGAQVSVADAAKAALTKLR